MIHGKPKTQDLYESIKDTCVKQEHQTGISNFKGKLFLNNQATNIVCVHIGFFSI